MCTVTWFFAQDGYELFVNRDELRRRGRALPPTPAETAGIRYLAPTDIDAGGTWLAVSQAGVAVGLLNAQSPETPPKDAAVSRGQLVRELADLEAPEQLAERLAEFDLSRRMPFTLFALAADNRSAVYDFDGERLSRRQLVGPPLLSSSSLVPGGAAEPRHEELTRWLAGEPDPERARLSFHCSHRPERGPLSPCMHRPDARTVSFSHVRVDGDSVRFTYVDGPPCSTGAHYEARLERSDGPSPPESATRGE